MKVHTTKFLTIIIVSLLAFVMTTTVCSAQEWSRAGRRHLFGGYQSMENNWQSQLDDNITYGGIGVGWDATDHWSYHMDLLCWALMSDSSKDDDNVWEWGIANLDYNFSEDRLTPFVTGGVGAIGLSSRDGDTDFCCSFGAGIRWDVPHELISPGGADFCIRVAYRYILTDGDLHGLSIGIGVMF